MKYMVWELVNSYEGFLYTECETWEKAEEMVRNAAKNVHVFNKWKAGKSDKVETGSGVVFVTSMPVNENK